MSSRLTSKRILVTGGSGFLGQHLIRRMKKLGYEKIMAPTIEEYDLTKMDAVKEIYKNTNPSVVIHLAARVGGIGANMKNPGRFFYDNLMMGVQMIEQGRLFGIEKF